MKRALLILVAISLLAAVSWPGGATEKPSTAWLPVHPPRTNDGLVMQPTLAAVRDRLHMVWGGTTAKIRTPEVFYAGIDDGSSTWTKPRALFLGLGKGRVRRLGLGSARTMLGLIFERQMFQSKDAYEVLFSMSADDGWSFSRPYTVDSFVTDQAGGTCVAVDGRQGINRPEFGIAWAADGNSVRAAGVDITSNQRPRARDVGLHPPGDDKVAVASIGSDGFAVVWSDGHELRTSHIRPLTGGVGKPYTLLTGQFDQLFAVAGLPYGPGMVMAVDQNHQGLDMTYQDGQWTKGKVFPIDLAGGEMQARGDIDRNHKMHVAIYTGVDNGNRIYATTNAGGHWSAPQLVMTLQPQIKCTGFDLACTNHYVWVVASQANDVYLRRKPLKS